MENLASNFISALSRISDDELKKIVDNVKKMDLDGPTVDELFSYDGYYSSDVSLSQAS